MTEHRIQYALQLADNALILGHRNSEWCGHGPVLEQDIAISNISLDLIGQARNFYQHAATLINENNVEGYMMPATEDTLAYFRDSPGFRNVLLVEQPRGDWAGTVLRQFFFSAYQHLLFENMIQCPDEQLVAIAAKSLKEVKYHLRWSGEWVVRLGDGTDESHKRIAEALRSSWPFTGEMFSMATYEMSLSKTGSYPDNGSLRDPWSKIVKEILEQAQLEVPGDMSYKVGGKEGKHTIHLDAVLAELQSVARAYPGATW